MRRIEVIGLEGIPEVKVGDDVARLIYEAFGRAGLQLKDGDIIVVAHKIVSKAEGRIVKLSDVKPSREALRISKLTGKNPKIVELALRDSSSIVKALRGHLITETRHGWFYSCSGVDLSNVSGGGSALLLPIDPDRSAREIRLKLEELSGSKLAVIISDTSGRPLRRGDIDVALGVSGIRPILDLRGRRDHYGYTLRLKQVALADELASAAELVMGQCDEWTPVALIRGYIFERDEESDSRSLKRSRSKDIFLR